MSPSTPTLLWPVDRLPDAIEQMAHRAGLGARAGEPTRPDPAVEPGRVWMFALAGRLRIDFEPSCRSTRKLRWSCGRRPPPCSRSGAKAVPATSFSSARAQQGSPARPGLLGPSASVDGVLGLFREEKQAKVAREVDQLLSGIPASGKARRGSGEDAAAAARTAPAPDGLAPAAPPHGEGVDAPRQHPCPRRRHPLDHVLLSMVLAGSFWMLGRAALQAHLRDGVVPGLDRRHRELSRSASSRCGGRACSRCGWAGCCASSSSRGSSS